MRVLVIKTSSLGDVIHTLPALTDAMKAIPDITVDWVVEEGFQEIPSWHPAVSKVIPVAIRRWRKAPLKTLSSLEWKEFRLAMRQNHYDCIIDAQGLLKSAWLTRLASGPIFGYDRRSVREGLASFFYHHKIPVSREMHAVERTRLLFSQALGYQLEEGRGHYQLDLKSFHTMAEHDPFVIFFHGTTREDKHWPETYWHKLAMLLVEAGYRIRVPWGNPEEKARAERIAELHEHIEILPRLNLRGVAEILAEAAAAVAVDTGLGHLSAALEIPTISLDGPTDPGLVGAYGPNQLHLKAADYPDVAVEITPEVFAPLTPAVVWDELKKVLE